MARIGFVGTGAITAAMVQGLAGAGHEIRVSPRNAETAADLESRYPEVTICPNGEVVAGSDYVILALMAGVARQVLPALPFRADQKVISAMADVPLAEVRLLCAPACDVSITIPLPSIAGGGSPLPVYPDDQAVRRLFGGKNHIILCQTETSLNAHYAAVATSLPLLALVETTRDWLVDLTGDADGAETYLSAIFASYFNDISHSGTGRLDQVIEELSTEGGLNATLREALEAHGTPAKLSQALDDLRPRLGLPPQ